MAKLKLLLVACLIGLVATPAAAIDFTQKLKDDDGVVMKICVEFEATEPGAAPTAERKCKKEVELTLAFVVRTALYQDERDLNGDEKFRRVELGQGLTGATSVTLKSEDLALIKKQIAKTFVPLVVHRAFMALEPDEYPKKKN